MGIETRRLIANPPNTKPFVKAGVNWYKRALAGEHQANPENLMNEDTVGSESIKDFLLKFVVEIIPNSTKEFQSDLQKILNSPNVNSIQLMILQLIQLQAKNPQFEKEIETIKSNFQILEKYEKKVLETLGVQRLEAVEKIVRIKPQMIITTIVRNNLKGIQHLYQNMCKQNRAFPIAWLVINNASTDETREFLHQIRNEEFVVVLDSNEQSGWPVFGRNFVINSIALFLQQRAVDDTVYVGRVDSDDWLAHPESLTDFYRKLQKLNYPAELVGKSIIRRDGANILYPSNLKVGDPTIFYPWQILEAGISSLSSLTRADIYTRSTLPKIPTIEDAFSRVLFEIIRHSGGDIVYDDLIFAIKDETENNNNNRSSQMAKQGKYGNIDVGNFNFEGLRALYFQIILEITRMQLTSELYK